MKRTRAMVGAMTAVLAAAMMTAKAPQAGAQCEFQLLGPVAAIPHSWSDFGYTMASDNERLIVGAPRGSYFVYESRRPGAAHIFRAEPDGWVEEAVVSVSEEPYDESPWFGFSVAIEDDLAVIGAPYEFDDVGAVYVYRREATSGRWWLEARILGPAFSAGSGGAVVIDGNRIIVGAMGLHGGGRVLTYVFVQETETWELEDVLAPSDWETARIFGRSIALDGDRMAIGAIWADGAAHRTGAIYIFERNPLTATWVETAKLFADDGQTYARFGIEVALHGDLLVVGADEDDGEAPQAGAVYTFEQIDGEWVQMQKLTASDAGINGRFGRAIRLVGDEIVIGAPSDSHYHVASRVYVFARDGQTGTWVEVQQLDPGREDPASRFGHSLALHNEALLVSSPLRHHERPESIFRFERVNGRWTVVDRLDNPGAAIGTQMGRTLEIDGDTAVVGRLGRGSEGGSFGGADVFRFDRDLNAWRFETALTSPDPNARDSFGRDVAISGDRILVGAPNDNVAGEDAGASYVFEYDEDRRAWLQTAVLRPHDIAPYMEFGTGVALDGDVAAIITQAVWPPVSARIARGAAYTFRYDPNTGAWIEEQRLESQTGSVVSTLLDLDGEVLAYADWPDHVLVFRHRDGAWRHEATLEPWDGAVGTYFGIGLAIDEDRLLVGAPIHDHLGHRVGAAYAYHYDQLSGKWLARQIIYPLDPLGEDFFGWSLSIDGDAAIIGAPANASPTRGGGVHSFTLDPKSGEWLEVARWIPSAGAIGEYTGLAIGLSGEHTVIGAPRMDLYGERSGGVYFTAIPLCDEREREP